MSKKLNIGIIGAGYTGLTAALKLAQNGHQITIFEKGNEAGGLASGFEIGGENLEKVYHHIFRTDRDIINLVNEIGIADNLEWLPSSVSIYYQNKLYPFGGALDLIKFSPLNFFNRVRTGIVMLYLQKDRNWEKFQKVSAYEWMLKYCGKQAVDVIWKPLLFGKFGEVYKDISMAWLWARIHTRANSRESLLAKEKLGYFNGGFNVITQKLVELLIKQGVTFEFNSDIASISPSTNGLQINMQSGEVKSFEKIIATVPSHIFAKMISNEKSLETQKYIAKLESIKYLGAVVGVFTSEQDLSPYYWNNINDDHAPFLAFINHTKFVEKKRYGGKSVYYIGTYLPHEHKYFNLDKNEIFDEWFDYLKKIFPDFSKGKVEDLHLFKFKNAQHVVDLDYSKKIAEYESPLKGLYLANFSQIYPEDRGTNFAVREGIKIAKLIDRSN